MFMFQWWVYALFTMLFFSITNFLLKVAGHYGMNSIIASLILWLSVGFVGVIFLAYYYATGTFPENKEALSLPLLFAPVIAGVFLALGMYCLKLSLTTGPAGPAVAISAANALGVAMLSYIFLKEGLSGAKMVGMLMVIGGIVVMSFFE